MENFQQIMVQSISILVEEHIGCCIKKRVIWFDSYSCAPPQTLSKFIVKKDLEDYLLRKRRREDLLEQVNENETQGFVQK